METIIRLSEVAYWYPGRHEPAVERINLEVDEGEFILLYGHSGAGKSTLCRMLNGLVPKFSGGKMSGSVVVAGLDVKEKTITEMSSIVGMVFQDPDSQFVMDNVENEIVFGLENRRLKHPEIKERLEWVLKKFDIEHLSHMKTGLLSGGEKQKVVLASVVALKPRILVLDEPTSQLDPEARRDFLQLVAKLNKEDGLTVVIVEHNIDDVIGYVNHVFDMDSKHKLKPKDFLAKQPMKHGIRKREYQRHSTVIEVLKLSKSLSGKKILKNVSMEVCKGECLAIVGKNGAGKTTLVKHFNGLLLPDEGQVIVFGNETAKTPLEELAKHVAYLPQNPSDMLFCDTVEEEVRFTLKHMGGRGDVDTMLDKFNLLERKNDYPRDLSVGEKQRLALAAILISNPQIVVLDEPTKGIDPSSRRILMKTIHRMLTEHRTVVLVTQDEELVETLADRVVRLHDGRISDE